jgi:protein involved in polysaccharide export with SLBB domain
VKLLVRLIHLVSILALLGAATMASAQQPLDNLSAGDRDEEGVPTPAAKRAGLDVAATRLAGPVDPQTYRLGPGDRFLLVLRGPVAVDASLEVGPEGAILIPNEGVVFVAGRTLADARVDILARLHRVYRNVDVQLRLARPRSFRIYLTGRVDSPGPVSANGSYRVADVLTPARLADGASQRNIEVIHTDGSTERCDLQLFFQAGIATRNPFLRDGDVVNVPNATRFVHAEGALARPGRYELGQDDSLSTVLRLAGGLLPAARLEDILVVRFHDGAPADSVRLQSRDVIEGRRDLSLEDGSRFFVYYSPNYREMHRISIFGEVDRPGTYPIAEGRATLRDLVSWANGLLPTADSTAIRVHRANNFAGDGKDPELERLLRLSRAELTASEYEVLRTRLSAMREDYSVDWSRRGEGDGRDLLLQDGDWVRVDRRELSVRVGGEVRRPGILNYSRGRTVDQFIDQAGGYTNRAWRGKVRVTRAVTGQTLLASNVHSLDPGDIVWVPERPDRTIWESAKEILVALAEVATIVIAIRSLR